MTKSFDQILNDGKDRVAGQQSIYNDWKEQVSIIMNALHKLNSMYGNDDIHNIKIELKNCKKCNKASFILAARDLNNTKRIMRFHKTKWIAIERGVYYCGVCKKESK